MLARLCSCCKLIPIAQLRGSGSCKRERGKLGASHGRRIQRVVARCSEHCASVSDECWHACFVAPCMAAQAMYFNAAQASANAAICSHLILAPECRLWGRIAAARKVRLVGGMSPGNWVRAMILLLCSVREKAACNVAELRRSGAHLSSCASGLSMAPEGEVAGRRLGGFLVSSSPQAG